MQYKVYRLNISRRMRWAGRVARMSERRGACKVFVGKPEGRVQCVEWIDVAQDSDKWRALVNAVMNLRVL